MSLRLYDFTCTNGHTTEQLTNPDQREVICPVCGHTSRRIISPVSTIFKGSGWPDADDKWARDHEKAAKLK
jgi:putative FmdB family regulatory protein